MGVLVTNPHPGMLGGMKEGGRCFLETAGGRGVGVQRHAHPRRPGGPVPHPPSPDPSHPRVPEITPVPRHPPLLHILALGTTLGGGVHTRRAFPSTPPSPALPPPPGSKTQA